MKPIEPMEPMKSSTLDRIRNNYVVQAWLVLILAICFGGSLAAMQLALGPLIEANKINETLQKVPEMLLGPQKAQKLTKDKQLIIEPVTIEVETNNRKVFYSVFKAKHPNGSPAGWVAKAVGQGYADKIEILVGMDHKLKKITGLFVLDQKETPGLGNKIITSEWRRQFVKKKTSVPLTVTKEGAKAAHEIDSITGATISSRAVCSIINATIKDLRDPLSKRKN
ncbi:MAG: electron transport complex protein RnfG [Candidatus Magnetoglobus multicellularis str. Araruama]|uniref:Ion-translocating oxidoreductase complex subunit G n=1 Tax=Candidatus Magnetoglobus multicellularis str. Araruama TaxID=890399 RepID=A0A1V1P7K7_9BACT|nr:MAG: electron transport complex protein RnfG [Candidatus Magnetoglobus multicellularis str. Araruama]